MASSLYFPLRICILLHSSQPRFTSSFMILAEHATLSPAVFARSQFKNLKLQISRKYHFIGLASVLCQLLIYQLCPEQGMCVVTSYKQNATGTVALCGWKGSIPIGWKLSSAWRHLLRFYSLAPWQRDNSPSSYTFTDVLEYVPICKSTPPFSNAWQRTGPSSYNIQRECSKTTATCNLL